MTLVTYSKPPITFAQQITRLEKKGMFFEDKEAAEAKLASISYYRLSGYWYPFRIRNNQNVVTSQFRGGTNFNKVVSLYQFDRKLRSLVFDAIEYFEVAVRTQFTYQLGHSYGAFAHINRHNFHPKFKHYKWVKKLKSEVKRSTDDFIRHYENKYNDFPIVPIWMLTEVMSLGSLSHGYEGLKNNNREKKHIARYFNLHYKKLENWLHVLTYIRNICAHHSRLWNRALAIKPSTAGDARWSSIDLPRNDRIFYILLMLNHLLKATNNADDWSSSIIQLLRPLADKEEWRLAMGIPESWEQYFL
ncbi:Abi family protein [Psychrobacter celer]|uniref:Abi family protein n=1 Tax=Psychrobacter celer TaxID=306572 RepID=UPI003FD0ECCC